MHELPEICRNMCRICFAKTTKGEFKNVFNKEDPSKGLSHLGNIYEELFQLSIIPDDNYPQYFCNYCAFQIKLFHKFRIKAIEAYNNMMKVVQVKREDNQQPSTSLKLKELEISFDLNKFHSENVIIKSELFENIDNSQDVNEYEDDENCNDCVENIYDENIFENENLGTESESENGSQSNEFENFQFLESEFITTESKESKVYDDEEEEVSAENENVFLIDEGDSRFQISDKEEQAIYNTQTHTNDISKVRLIKFSVDKTSQDIDKIGKGRRDLILKYECNCCDEKFSTVIKLKRHKLSFHSTLNAESMECCSNSDDGETLKYTSQRREETTHCVINAHTCNKCEIVFATKRYLELHRKEKHSRTLYSCTLCPKKCYSEETLQVHMNLHNGLPAYKCEECGKEFKQKAHHVYHMLGHRNERNVQCHLCGKGFLNNSDLRVHLRVHNDERRYQCDICEKKFRAHTHMTNHRYSHFEKQLECPMCTHKYSSPNTLRTHIKAVHKGERTYECEFCYRKFKRKHHLKAHYKTHQRNLGSGGKSCTSITEIS